MTFVLEPLIIIIDDVQFLIEDASLYGRKDYYISILGSGKKFLFSEIQSGKISKELTMSYFFQLENELIKNKSLYAKAISKFEKLRIFL